MKTMSRLVAVLGVMVAAGYGVTLIAQSGTVVQRTKLRQATEIQGYACAKDYAWFYSDGKLQRCTTSREIAVGVAQVQRGSIIELLPDGRPNYVMMLHDAAVGEVECSGGNWLLGPSEGRWWSCIRAAS